MVRFRRLTADAEMRRVLAQQDGPPCWWAILLERHGDERHQQRPQAIGAGSVAARAPDDGEYFVALSGKFPTTPVRGSMVTHDGKTTLTEDAYTKYFANGIPHKQPLYLQAGGGLRHVQRSACAKLSSSASAME